MMQQSLFLLDRAARRDPGDLPVLENRGYALLDQRRAEEALEVFGEALMKAPDREQALSWAVEAAIVLDRLDEAESYAGGWSSGTRTTRHTATGWRPSF